MKIVQLIQQNGERAVAVVDGDLLRPLSATSPDSTYALALHAIASGTSLSELVRHSIGSDTIDYNAVYDGVSGWRLLPSFDHPTDPAHCMVSGTGLTHKASAEKRSAMHKSSAIEVTDSMRMYQLGLEGGTPPPGQVGVQPEWFYKGDGSILRGPNDDLEIPSYAWDGGEEPELAGAYVISSEGKPYRVGITMGNEFSDHKMEKKNYLYLAPSKLRNCSIGPELVIGPAPFEHTPGTVSIYRGGVVIWQKEIWSGERNMSYSVQNLEHHHFKYAAHRRPGDCHIHFYGADAFSFGEGVALAEGDLMEVSFQGFGRPLRNRLKISTPLDELVAVTACA